MNKIGLVLLAAGASRRMGQPKQLLELEGLTLIETVIGRLANTGESVFVILGANKDLINAHLNKRTNRGAFEIIFNPIWKKGLSTSIHAAVVYLENNYPEIDHLLFCLVDQPYLMTQHFQQLIGKSREFPDKIISAKYKGKLGSPMLFPRKYFPKLRNLTGDQGAGEWVRNIPEQVQAIDLPLAAVDWDSPQDLQI